SFAPIIFSPTPRAFVLPKFVCVLIGEQRWLSAGMQKQYGFMVFEEPLSDQINHSCCGAAGVDRIQQESLILSKQPDGYSLSPRDDSVARVAVICINENIRQRELDSLAKLLARRRRRL